MARRATIGRNPLSKPADAQAIEAGARTARPRQSPADTRLRQPKRRDRPRDAIGGRLELLGGDLGRSTALIGLFGGDRRMGLYTPNDEFIDLNDQVASIEAWPDHTEHRITAAIGWGWGLGVVVGVAGAALGFGLRVLQPRHMIFEMHLRDGRSCVGRTDEVTIGGLDAIARSRTGQTAK